MRKRKNGKLPWNPVVPLILTDRRDGFQHFFFGCAEIESPHGLAQNTIPAPGPKGHGHGDQVFPLIQYAPVKNNVRARTFG